jgi:DNA-binding protein H-NS
MPTYQEYLDQIAKLQSLAEAARQDELADAKRRILELMRQHGLSLDDFEGAPKKLRKVRGKSGPAPVKYRDPESGKSWTGRGRTPGWLEGKNKDNFLVK